MKVDYSMLYKKKKRKWQYVYIMDIHYLALISYRSGFPPKGLCEKTEGEIVFELPMKFFLIINVYFS